MFAEERQEQIAKLLNEKSGIKVSEFASIFGVSESTIRRDLQEMEERGLLTRTHGGAVGKNRTNFEPSFKEKEDAKHEEKLKIAEMAASMIEEGDTVLLDTGTTTLEIAKKLGSKKVVVITNSIDIAAELSSKENVNLIVTGGNLRIETRSMVGPITEGVLKNFRVDKAFIGANGISIEEGITTPNVMEAQAKKSMIRIANKVIVVADSSKFNEVCFSIICPTKVVSSILTSGILDPSIIEQYKEIGVEILISE